jgi:uncharacterized membrane protein (DUF4010 family)
MNTVYCYDRNAQIKRLGVVVAIMIAAVGAGAMSAQDDRHVAMSQLPRVEITGQSIPTQIALARETNTVAQLPRVVVEGQRNVDGQRIAQQAPSSTAQ